MLIVAGTMTLRPDALGTLRSILGRHTEATMAEKGCELFSLGVSDDAEGIVTVLEIWRDEPALVFHHAQPHTHHFLDLLGDAILALDIRIYNAVASRPLPPLEALAGGAL
jgi:quinol monooxygenase YgiN